MRKLSAKSSIVIGILAIVLIIGAGFVVWRGTHKTTKNAANVTTNKQQTTDTANNASTDADKQAAAQADKQFLVIKEWGVKVPLTEATRAGYYKMENGYVYLYLDIDGDAAKDCSNQAALARITDYSEAAEDWRQKPSELDKAASKIGDVYYLLEGSQAGCTFDEQLQEKASGIRADWLRQGRSILPV